MLQSAAAVAAVSSDSSSNFNFHSYINQLAFLPACLPATRLIISNNNNKYDNDADKA